MKIHELPRLMQCLNGDSAGRTNKGRGKDGGWDSIGNTLLVFSNGDVKHGDAGGRGRRTKVLSLKVEARGQVIVVG